MITVCHHSANLVMPMGVPRDELFYIIPTLMVDSYKKLCKIQASRKEFIINEMFSFFLTKINVMGTTKTMSKSSL